MRTTRTSKLPPFSTQIIGGFPRPRVVPDLLARRAEFTPERYREIMDDLVRFAIRTLGMAGLNVVSDGQWRGHDLDSVFLRRMGALDPAREGPPAVVKRMNPMGSIYKADADFLINNTARLTLITLPSPLDLAARYWHPEHSAPVYATRHDFIDHLVELLSAEVHALVHQGIDIIQIDDTTLLSADDAWQKTIAVLNHFADNALNKTEIHLHCHPATPDAAVDYGRLFARLADARIDRVNLASAARDGHALEDLQKLPSHIDLGLGVLDVRPGTTQTPQQIAALALGAAQVIAPARIALNPDGSFHGVTFDEAYAKLRALTAAARNLRAQNA